MTQTGNVTGQVGASLAMRTERQSVFSIGLFTNRFLIVAIAVEMLLAVTLIYVPSLNTAFHQSPIGPWHWLVLLTFAPLGACRRGTAEGRVPSVGLVAGRHIRRRDPPPSSHETSVVWVIRSRLRDPSDGGRRGLRHDADGRRPPGPCHGEEYTREDQRDHDPASLDDACR